MEETVHQHHLHIHFHHLPGEPLGIDAALREPVHACAFDELEHEHTLPRELRHHRRDHHARIAREVRAHLRRVLGFLAEIHLLADTRRELLHERLEPLHVRHRPTPRRPRRDRARRTQVAIDRELDARPQHLHRDIVSVPARAMHLTERGRSDRRTIDRLEHRLGFLPVRRDDLPTDLLPRHRRHLIRERAELREIGLRDQVRARSENLRELHERRPQRRDARDQSLGALLVERRRADDRRAPPQPSPLIAQQRDDEGAEREEDAERVH